jgi:F0F1-type ATP synthase membrane subunit b/b'
MTEDLIAQVKAIEADADDIVSESFKRAEQIRAGVAAMVARLREEQRRSYQQELDGTRRKLDSQAAEEMQQVDRQAQAVAKRLDSIDPDAIARAVDMILQHLGEA